MGRSEAWIELGYRQGQNITSIGTHTESHDAVIAILDMLDIAIEQSESGSQNKVWYFFSRIDSILNHLMSIGTIRNIQQAYICRRKVMESLNMKNIDVHIQLYSLLQQHPNHRSHLDLSIANIEKRISEGESIQSSTDIEWYQTDKKYFLGTILTTIVQYRVIMKAYFFQKYGRDLMQKNKFAK